MNFDVVKEIFAARRSLFIALVLIALADVALYAFLSLYQEPRLARAQEAYRAGRVAAAADTAGERVAAYKEGTRDLALFEERILPKKNFASFLAELFDMAHRDGLALKGISYKPGPVKGQTGLVSYGMTLSVQGKYPAVKVFIADLSRYPKIVTVDAVSLKSSSKTEESVDLQLELTAFLKTEGA